MSVDYSLDGKIKDVYALLGQQRNGSKWKLLTPMLNNLGSLKHYYDFSSIRNPFNEVVPPHLSSYESQGMFDVMMQVAYDYIKQTNQNVTLAVVYDGYGFANSPRAKVLLSANSSAPDIEEVNYPYWSKQVAYIYNPNILYGIKYHIDKTKYKESYKENDKESPVKENEEQNIEDRHEL